ncbi:DUF1127 domain-containing protein [Marivita sp. S0852]|uniref:DUF1127 domain-containing protein n=1 Tax=Marivita sp. S0852 TaxID=3373893 RepID=UPI0039821F83
MALTQSYQDEKQGFLSRLIDGLSRGFSQVTETNWRIREVERLQAMTDEALQAKGLRRDDIVRHVFQDMFWQ